MKKSPSLHTVDGLLCQKHNMVAAEIDGEWVAARPLGLFSFRERLRLAWGVFVGRYDALKWPNGQ